MIKSYRDLDVWKKSVELSVAVYELTRQFPREEIYGLTSQMRRSSVSIASNIAEGRYRSSRKDYARFIYIAFGSGAELETQIHIAKQLSETESLDYSKVDTLLDDIMRMLNALTRSLGNNL